MIRPTCLVVAVSALACCATSAVHAEEVHDLIFWTPYAVGKPKTANFYCNGRAIGEGREGFEKIVERIGKLPHGASVVWGPNYARCGSCSGNEPNCVLKYLYPDLWTQLEQSVRDRGLFLSSAYPGPVFDDFRRDLSAYSLVACLVDAVAEKDRFDAVLDWQIGEKGEDHFASSGKSLDEFHRQLLLDTLPERGRVLVRLSDSEKLELAKPDSLRQLADHVSYFWRGEIARRLARGKLKAVVTTSPKLAESIRTLAKAEQSRFVITWNNFRGPSMPESEVLYLVNNEYVGRGDEGVNRILSRLDKLPPGTTVVFPRFFPWPGGTPVEITMRHSTPFPSRQKELEAKATARKLQIRPGFSPFSDDTGGSVLDWGGIGDSFESFGRIVRFDGKPRPAAARLAWSGYDAAERSKRKPVTEAVYTLNGTEQGRGTSGFATAMKKITDLPKGSVVDVRVCLRTRPPFLCPITIDGHRHFERTGLEPYAEMFPWLIDVARKKHLDIQWTPDELKSCGDCELDR